MKSKTKKPQISDLMLLKVEIEETKITLEQKKQEYINLKEKFYTTYKEGTSKDQEGTIFDLKTITTSRTDLSWKTVAETLHTITNIKLKKKVKSYSKLTGMFSPNKFINSLMKLIKDLDSTYKETIEISSHTSSRNVVKIKVENDEY